MIDLHMHTVLSDGLCQPEELVQAVLDCGLKAIAITDHDTTASYERACEAAKGTELELIPGIEVNTHWENKEVHILGYYIDLEDEGLQAVIRKHQGARTIQLGQMVEKIRHMANIEIHYDAVAAKSEGSLGRPHVARTLVESGKVNTIGEAFSKYLSPHCPTYVRRETFRPHEAVEAIYESGGIPVIAHPGDMDGIEELTEDLMNYGLRGLEAYHKSHSPALIEFHCSLAEKYGLLVTGGTDFHGEKDNYASALARVHMPDYIYQSLRDEIDGRQKYASVKVS